MGFAQFACGHWRFEEFPNYSMRCGQGCSNGHVVLLDPPPVLQQRCERRAA